MKFEFSNEDVLDIADLYFNIYSNILKKERPKEKIIYFFAGQPGAGKSQLKYNIPPNYLYHSIYINPDLIKLLTFKKLEKFKKNYENYKENSLHNLLSEFTDKVEDKLIELAFKEKLNIINDRDFGSDKSWNFKYFELMKNAKKKGYKVYFYGLAVNPQISILGNYYRYFSGQENRLVPLKIHNKRYNNLIINLKQLIFKEKLVDQYILYKRDYNNNGLMKLKSYNSKIQSFRFLKDFMIERTRELNPKEKVKLNLVYKKTKFLIKEKYKGDDTFINNNLKKLNMGFKFAKTLVTNEKRSLKRYFKL